MNVAKNDKRRYSMIVDILIGTFSILIVGNVVYEIIKERRKEK
ncbi:hypothetical protein [Bacillus cereus]|nr:hypothetical protein [Bacillus cereus]BCA37411.1 hypothetical protein BwiPL1_57930 [Bacillus wiedmannii]